MLLVDYFYACHTAKDPEVTCNFFLHDFIRLVKILNI
jgi:hypothetical protein